MSQHLHWTPEVKAAFIDALAASGEVLAAVETVGLSPQSAYRHRALDPEFARAWDSARIIAREVVVEELRSRALHGWEENVYFRGELVGTKKRHDNRLLLALLARLDSLAGDQGDATAHRARNHFGRLVESLENGEPTSECYLPSPVEVVEELETGVDLRLRKRMSQNSLADLDYEEETLRRIRATLADEDDEEDEGDYDEGDYDVRDFQNHHSACDTGENTDEDRHHPELNDSASGESLPLQPVDPQPDVPAARGHHPVSPLPPETPPDDSILSPDGPPANTSTVLSGQNWCAVDAFTDSLLPIVQIDRPPGPSIRAL